MLQLLVAGLTVGSAYALVALGLHIILRATRVVNFAQGEFAVVGGLIALSATQVLHVNLWGALLVATAAGFAIGVAYERLVIRPAYRNGEAAATIATIGTIFVLLYGHALVPAWGSLPQPLPPFSGDVSDAVTFGGVSVQVQSLWVFALLVCALGALWFFFERTYAGKAIRAACDNPLGASLCGIDVARMQSLSVGIAIALAAFGGAIVAPITLAGGAGGTVITIKGFVGAVIGGLDSPVGCVLGGLLVGVTEKLLQGQVSYGVADPLVYSLLLVALLIRPQGLFGSSRVLRD